MTRHAEDKPTTRHRSQEARMLPNGGSDDPSPSSMDMSPTRKHPTDHNLLPVAASELVNVISTIVLAANGDRPYNHSEHKVDSWTSSCGKVTVERRETPHDELRFFIQNPDDYYTEHTLRFCNTLVFAHRDLVWRNARTSARSDADSTEDVPKPCWNILSRELRSRAVLCQ